MLLRVLLNLSLVILVCQARGQRTAADGSLKWNDSLCVADYINNASICEKLSLVYDNAAVFAREQGFAILLLSDITRRTKKQLSIPIGRWGTRVTDAEKVNAIEEQILDIMKECCKTDQH